VRPSKSDPKSNNLHLELVVDEAAHPEMAGVRLYDERSLKEQSWFRVVELLEAVKKGELSADNAEGDLEFDEEALVGESVGCGVSVDDVYDPENPRNRVDFYFNPEEPVVEEPPVPPKEKEKKGK